VSFDDNYAVILLTEEIVAADSSAALI